MHSRKAFKFYRSYFDVAMELSDDDRYQFLMALLECQFTGKQRELKGMAKFAFISQKHSIDAQINGFLTKVGATLPPTQGAIEAPSQQEEEKEQEKEEGKYVIAEQTKIFGSGKNFFTVKKKYIHDKIITVNGVDGLKEFMEANKSILNYQQFAEKFMKRFNGGQFNDFQHVWHSYNKFTDNA
jgi:hypothetical protein